MSLRAPKQFGQISKVVNPKTGLAMVEAEILSETATSLGHHGRKVERALEALQAAEEAEREDMLYAAAREVWAYFIQREMMGMRDHRLIIREMGIPDAVLRRLGAIR